MITEACQAVRPFAEFAVRHPVGGVEFRQTSSSTSFVYSMMPEVYSSINRFNCALRCESFSTENQIVLAEREVSSGARVTASRCQVWLVTGELESGLEKSQTKPNKAEQAKSYELSRIGGKSKKQSH